MPTLNLPAGLRDFLDYCRTRVTENDIEAGIMSDPGSPGYFRICNEIRISGKVPASYSVSLDEVFSTVHICIRLEDRKPTLQELNFLCFVYAAAMAHVALGGYILEWQPLERMMCRLLQNIPAMPPEYTRLVYKALLSLRAVLAERGLSVEGPFLTLGAIILAQRLRDFPTSERLAAELIAEENIASATLARDNRFLVSLTRHEGAQLGWMELTRELQKHHALATVIREIEESWVDP
jgi:hypothetical protein